MNKCKTCKNECNNCPINKCDVPKPCPECNCYGIDYDGCENID